MRISDCSSDVCSSDLLYARARESKAPEPTVRRPASGAEHGPRTINQISAQRDAFAIIERDRGMPFVIPAHDRIACGRNAGLAGKNADADLVRTVADRHYEHADAQVRRIRHLAPIIQ